MDFKAPSLSQTMTKFIKFALLQFFLPVVFVNPSAAASREDELAPGFDACMDRAASASYDDGADCYKKAGDYQARRLEAAYKKARKLCDQGDNPAQCKNELKKLELAWLDFQSRVYTFCSTKAFSALITMTIQTRATP